MNGIYFHECKKCGVEIECPVEGKIVDIPDKCEECGAKIDSDEQLTIYSAALEDVLSSAIDDAHDRMKDRNL